MSRVGHQFLGHRTSVQECHAAFRTGPKRSRFPVTYIRPGAKKRLQRNFSALRNARALRVEFGGQAVVLPGQIQQSVARIRLRLVFRHALELSRLLAVMHGPLPRGPGRLASPTLLPRETLSTEARHLPPTENRALTRCERPGSRAARCRGREPMQECCPSVREAGGPKSRVRAPPTRPKLAACHI